MQQINYIKLLIMFLKTPVHPYWLATPTVNSDFKLLLLIDLLLHRIHQLKGKNKFIKSLSKRVQLRI